MDYLHQAGEPPGMLSPSLPTTNPRHHMARQSLSNTAVLEKTGCLSMHLLLCQRRLRWLGHVHRVKESHIPNDVMHDELATGHRPAGRPVLCFEDVNWELLADDRASAGATLSDKGPRRAKKFTTNSWRTEDKAGGSCRKFSSSNHPSTLSAMFAEGTATQGSD